jgi:hypothetical protein
MKRMTLVLTGILGFGAFFMACTKDPLKGLTSDESRIYITSYDSAADFASYKSYNIADSVGIISNGGTKRGLTAADQAYIDAVNKYMQQRGYLKVNANQYPDIGINVNRIYSTSTGLIDYNDYWDYYGGYWDPGSWGYPGYGYYVPYAYGVYQITEGMMSVDMFDLKNAQKNNKINLIWNGLVRGEGVFDAQAADSSVAQLYNESQYLHSGQ